jgi:hypothetical protein
VSDYQVIDPVTLDDAQKALKRSESFIEAIRKHLMPKDKQFEGDGDFMGEK